MHATENALVHWSIEPRTRARTAFFVAALGSVLAACGGGGGGAPPGPPPGQLIERSDGTLFISDAHFGGAARDLRLAEIQWGRLVDVYDVDANGERNPRALLRDLVVNETILTDAIDYEVSTNPLTLETDLVILRTRGEDDSRGTFEELVLEAVSDLPTIIPKKDDGTQPGPFSFVARNSALVLRFDDLLEDGPNARAHLTETVRVLCGYPPRTPFAPRIVFDRCHGGFSGDEFHSTRVLVDLTVSEVEAAELGIVIGLNSIGLPASAPGIGSSNASIRLPTRIDVQGGVFHLLTNLIGNDLAEVGPVDPASPGRELVRAMRSGNALDTNGGFLVDFAPPQVIGQWPIVLEEAVADPPGQGFHFRITLSFETACRDAPRTGDLIAIGTQLFEIVDEGVQPDTAGRVPDVLARYLGVDPLDDAAELLGGAEFLTPMRSTGQIARACWLRFVPAPGEPPDADVATHAQVVVRFSEPMDPASAGVFDNMRIMRGSSASGQNSANDFVVASLSPSPDLKEYTITPALPFSNFDVDEYRVEHFGGVQSMRDLGGNQLTQAIGVVDFLLDPDEPTIRNAGVALRFSQQDEILPAGMTDVRGQVTYDLARGVLKPRPAASASAPCDRGNPLVRAMTPWPTGVWTPLSPLGSKMQGVWRYADFDWRVADETFHNLDVTGMYWAPALGGVVSDFFERFEMRLSHANMLPDEENPLNPNGPRYPLSGIQQDPSPYTDNILLDPRSPQVIVHHRAFGYHITPSDAILNSHNTILMPFPFNRVGGPFITFTWRDTAVLARGGGFGAGIPMGIEVDAPHFFEPAEGTIAGPSDIPSIGLPLLWEVRCFPQSNAIGTNALDMSMATFGYPTPRFRVYSTGGIDISQQQVIKNPDLELTPSGGFNARSIPPGRPTIQSGDNTFYIGQMDYIVRVSRAHTIWIDTTLAAPRYAPAMMEPKPFDQPQGTRIVLEFRGADAFQGAGNEPFDAQLLDFYGDVRNGAVDFHDGVETWTEDIDQVDGARFLQIRMSFINDIETLIAPELVSLGVAYEE